MFNRRLLRIKALQTYYSFSVSKEANHNLAHEQIAEIFSPDLNSMEFQDKKLLNEQKEKVSEALTVWQKSYNTTVPALEEPKLKNALTKVMFDYDKRVKEDAKRFGRILVEQTEAVFYWYLFSLQLGIEVAKYVLAEEEERQNRMIKVDVAQPHELKLVNNKFLKVLEENNGFQRFILQHKISFKNELDLVKSVYKNSLKKDEKYAEYVAKKEVTEEEELTFLKHFYNNIILKSADLSDYLEKEETRWQEDKAVVKDMISKTIKHIQAGDTTILAALSASWEDDKEFMLTLFNETINLESEIEQQIAPNIKNWDIDRIALSDKLILNMAISEMMNFPSIPVKVTINEFLELTKNYSTPQSKDFINGILDTTSEMMMKAGKIRKSGRGLMDNK